MPAAETSSSLPKRVAIGGGLGAAALSATALGQTIAPAAAPTPAAADAAMQLPTVEIGASNVQQGYQVNLPSLSRFTQPLLDTPQSVSVVPRQLIDDQGIVQTRDALRNVPGISLGAGEAGAQGDNLTLRGFSARNDFYLDGMRDFGSYYRDPFDLEAIEVLKGPSSVAFGRGSTGGVINQVSKQPGITPITAGTVSFGTDGTKRITGDINRAIDAIPGAAVRLNVMADENGVADRNHDTYRRFGIAPSIAFGLGTPTRLAINYLHQQGYDTPDYGLPWLYGQPAAVNRSNFYGFKNSDYLRTNVDVATVKFEHDVSSSVTVRDQFRYGNYMRDVRVTEPQVLYTGAGITVNPLTSLGAITVNRNMIAIKSTETFLQNQTDVTVRFETGALKHSLVPGTEVGRETSAPVRRLYNSPAPQRTNLLYPSDNDTFVANGPISSDVFSQVTTVAAFAIDTIRLGEQWDLTAGLRYDVLSTEYEQRVTPAVSLQRTDQMPSYRVALAYKPVPAGTLYVAYGTSFNPSADGLTLATSTAGLAPEENETYEVGAKWEVLERKLTLSGALFQLEKTNARVTDPNNSAFQILGGDQRVRGFELGVIGNITERWQISAGYALLDSETVKTTLAGTQGQVLANTPKHSGSVFTTYALPWRPFGAGDVQIGAGLNGVSSRLASSSPDRHDGGVQEGRRLRDGAVDGEGAGAAGAGGAAERLQPDGPEILRLAAPGARDPRGGADAAGDAQLQAVIVLDGVLSPGELGDIRAALTGAAWASGRNTAGWQAAGVKENGQLDERDPLAARLSDQVMGALERSKPFIAAALPLRLYPPMFNRYAGGQTFGAHVDTAIRQVPGAPVRVRADLSATLFLSEPEEYEGGELIVEDETGARAAKLPAGSLVLYGAGTVHRVAPVVRGERLAAVMWVQSMVRDAGQRELLLELDRSIQQIASVADAAATVRLTGVYHNLLRRWAEC